MVIAGGQEVGEKGKNFLVLPLYFYREGKNNLKRYKSLLFILLIISLMGMQSAKKNNIIMPQNIPIQIFYSGNIKGYIEPCGCGGVTRGGLAKWSTFIKKNTPNAPINLIVDSGYFTLRQDIIKDLKTEYIAKVMSEIKYDAINISGRDIQQIDKNILMNLKEKYNLPFVSANIFHLNSMELLTKPYIIKSFTYANKKINLGIFGLAPQINLEKKELIIKEPINVAKEMVKELNTKCNLIILLTQLTQEESLLLAKEVGGIDIIISCGKFRVAKEKRVTKVENTLILQPGSQGEDGASIIGYISNEFKIVSFEEKYEQLDKAISPDKEIVKIIDEYKEKVKEDNKFSNPFNPFIRPMYAGVKKCSECHQKQYKKWKKTKHAKAFSSLQNVKEGKNPECLKCHTTKFNQDNGFLNYETSPDFANVGCEECHRLGIGHAFMAEVPSTSNEIMKISSKPGKVDSEAICTKCHTNDKDANFNFKKDKKKITH